MKFTKVLISINLLRHRWVGGDKPNADTLRQRGGGGQEMPEIVSHNKLTVPNADFAVRFKLTRYIKTMIVILTFVLREYESSYKLRGHIFEGKYLSPLT